MTTPIVVVQVSQQVAPTPSDLQKTGALISQGGTTLAAKADTLLTQLSDLTALLTPPQALLSLTWAGGTVTAVTVAPHGYVTGQSILLIIAGATPAGYNGTYLCTITAGNSFTYPLAVNPGAETVPGTVVSQSVNELVQMATTFFSQGNSQSVYVLELGAVDNAHALTNLSDFITASTPQFFYSYLVPRSWDNDSNFMSLLATFEAPTKKTYFFITTLPATYANYTTAMKCARTLIEASAAPVNPVTLPATEFSMAAVFYWSLNPGPSATNKVPPFNFTFVFGVTPFPQKGNAAFLTTIQAAGVNRIATGAEGGISNTIVVPGQGMDKRDISYWYSVDWVQINIQLDIVNAIINGSNDPTNPLYYNQTGIDRLQAVAARTMGNGITFGLVLNPIAQSELDGPDFTKAEDAGQFLGRTVINAGPFINYVQENPGDFKIGKYGGFAIVYTPNRGFTQIILNVVVTDFAAA